MITGLRLPTLRGPWLIALLLTFWAWFSLIAFRRGPDADWDLRNYHLYNGFVGLGLRHAADLIPAQLQTYLPSTLDVLYVQTWLLTGNSAGALAAVLALPHAVCALLVFLIARRVVPAESIAPDVTALVLTIFGVTGASGWPVLATSMSDMLPNACALMAILALLPRPGADTARAQSWLLAALAGALCGIAVGLKLTFVGFAIATGLATLAFPAPALRRLAIPALFFVCCALGALAIGAAHWVHLYATTGNPLFPYYNAIFRSPLIAPVNVFDERFKPHGFAHALLYPFTWAIDSTPRVTELEMRDPRLTLAMLAVAATLATIALRRRISAQGLFLLIVATIAYALWEIQFSIFRYVALIELLSGVVLLLPLQCLGVPPTGTRAPRAILALLPLGIATGATALALATTIYPNWGHAARVGPAIQVTWPDTPAGATVILLDSSPMSYVAVFAPNDVRFIGANNNLIRPGMPGDLSRSIEGAIRSAKDPLFGLESPADAPGAADSTLSAYRVRRGPCRMVPSNLDASSLRLCKLERIEP